MPTYEIRSPFPGTSRAQYCYCDAVTYRCWSESVACTIKQSNSNCHNSCNDPNKVVCSEHIAAVSGLCCPLDISTGTVNRQIFLVTSQNILSVYIARTNLSCIVSPPPGYEWVREGLKVDLFTNTWGNGTKIGSVFYGHVRNRISNGIYNYPYQNALGETGNQDCNCHCYSGIHVHLARSSGNGGTTIARACGTSVTTDSVVYRFTL
jgi:hypothetical protein